MTAQEHHHRSGLKQANKAFKGTTATKRAENRGKLFKNAGSNSTYTKELNKAQRLNKTAQKIDAKREALAKANRLYSGPTGLPRVLSIWPLTGGADPLRLRQLITQSAETEVFYSERHKRRFHFLQPLSLDCSDLEFIKQAGQSDTLVFYVSQSDGLEERGRQVLELVKAMGASSGVAVLLCTDLRSKKQFEMDWRNFFKSELPIVETFFTLTNEEYLAGEFKERDMFIFQAGNLHLKGISWREMRPYMLVEEVQVIDNRTRLIGHVRGRSVNANQLLHITGMENYRIAQIQSLNRNHELDVTIYPDVSSTEDVCMDASVDDCVDGQEDDYEMEAILQEVQDVNAESDDRMSINDEDCNTSEYSEVSEDGPEQEKNVKFADQDAEMNEVDPEDLLDHRSGDKKFPDELELDEDGSARDRLKKYRAVKSLRTSEWDVYEGLPEEYSQIFTFQNYKLSRKRALQLAESPMAVGVRVAVDIEGVVHDVRGMTALFLLKNEERMTVCNFTVKRVKSCDDQLRSKEQYLMVSGFRQNLIRPIFSEHSNNTLHKMLKELPEDGMYVASAYAPVTFDPCPVLLYHNSVLSCNGSILSNDPNRVVLKRVTLTGTPFKVHKKIVVVRFMFFNAPDIAYFKPVELHTKQHRRGHIRESLGTHGYMKCSFDKKIQHSDTVFMHLFKRVYPKV